MGDKKTKMSVIVPTHGRVDLFEKTLDSLIAQTAPNFEVIITDDSSNEEERNQIKNLVKTSIKNGLKAKYVFTVPNLRQAKNTNQGFKNAVGEYFRILHSDDLIASECIEKEIEILDEYRNVDFLNHRAILFKDEITFDPNVKITPYNVFEGWLSKNIFTSTALPTTMAFRKALYDEIGGMNEEYNFLCDWEFFFRMLMSSYSKSKNVLDISTGLVGWRVHSNSTTGTMALTCFEEHKKFIEHIECIYRKYKLISPEQIKENVTAAKAYRYKRVFEDYQKYHNFTLPAIPIHYKIYYYIYFKIKMAKEFVKVYL